MFWITKAAASLMASGGAARRLVARSSLSARAAAVAVCSCRSKSSSGGVSLAAGRGNRLPAGAAAGVGSAALDGLAGCVGETVSVVIGNSCAGSTSCSVMDVGMCGRFLLAGVGTAVCGGADALAGCIWSRSSSSSSSVEESEDEEEGITASCGVNCGGGMPPV